MQWILWTINIAVILCPDIECSGDVAEILAEITTENSDITSETTSAITNLYSTIIEEKEGTTNVTTMTEISTEITSENNGITNETTLTIANNYTTTIGEKEGTTNLTTEISTEIMTENSNITSEGTLTTTSDYNSTAGDNETTTEITTEHADYSCDSNPCKNGGTCQNISENEYECICTNGYAGNNCEVEDHCTTNGEDEEVCKNGACVYSKDLKAKTCRCFLRSYWDDKKNECRNADPPCFPNPCHNNGECKAQDENSHNCSCLSGYTGTHCEIVNECSDDDDVLKPCLNGRCVVDNQRRRKYCQCYEGFYYDSKSKKCLDINLPCLPNPCGDHGECIQTNDDSFNCTCEENFIGYTCEIFNDCPTEGCKHGSCRLSETKNVQHCQCENGYYFEDQTKTCRKTEPPCFPNPCKNKGECTSISEKEYNCSCIKGYRGENCLKRDLCHLDGGDTFCRSSHCVTDYAQETFYCDCGDGKYFDYAERTCRVLDMCPLMTCSEHEICESNTCVCESNFKWDNTTKKCETNFCSTVGCPAADMLCFESSDGIPEHFQCMCPEGFAFDGDRCSPAWCTFPSLNKCSQKCEQNDDNEYVCKCYENFSLSSDNRTCEIINEDSKCVNLTCEHGTCIKNRDTEICKCSSSYTEKDGNCIDLCSAELLPMGMCPDNKCKSNGKGNFQCQCEGKFQLSEDGVTCILRKMCSEGETGWTQCMKLNSLCVEDYRNKAGFKCICPSGSIQTDEGSCQKICEVNKHQAECSKLGAYCDVDIAGEFICKCAVGFKNIHKGAPCNVLAKNSYFITLPMDKKRYQKRKEEFKRSREIQVEEEINYGKIQNDVKISLMQLYEDLQEVNVIRCRVTGDYILCKVELQLEQSAEEDLKRIFLTSSCIYNKTLSSESCLLPPNLILKKGRLLEEIVIKRTNICDEDIKEDLCGTETLCKSSENGRSFYCSCKEGYRARSKTFPLKDMDTYIEYCNDINECEEEKPCPESTKCENTIGNFDCICLPGYRQKNNSSKPKVEGCVELCSPNPCTHGDCSIAGNHRFQCSCEAGYSGALCNFEDKFYKDAKVNTAIVGAVLGGILLITILLFISTVSRLRRKKRMDEPTQILYSAEMTERHPMRMGTANTGFQKDL